VDAEGVIELEGDMVLEAEAEDETDGEVELAAEVEIDRETLPVLLGGGVVVALLLADTVIDPDTVLDGV